MIHRVALAGLLASGACVVPAADAEPPTNESPCRPTALVQNTTTEPPRYETAILCGPWLAPVPQNGEPVTTFTDTSVELCGWIQVNDPAYGELPPPDARVCNTGDGVVVAAGLLHFTAGERDLVYMCSRVVVEGQPPIYDDADDDPSNGQHCPIIVVLRVPPSAGPTGSHR